MADKVESTMEIEEEGLLSKELMEELGGNEAELLIIDKKKLKGKKKPKIAEEIVQAATKLSKTKRKKLAQLEERKRKEARRDDIFQSLEAQKLSDAHLNLMYSTSKLGHKETLKERLKRSINQEKAGITLSESARHELYPELRRIENEKKKKDEIESTDMDVDESTPQQEEVSTASTHDQDKTVKEKKKKKVIMTVHSAAKQSEVTKDKPTEVATMLPLAGVTANEVAMTSESAMMTKLLALRAKNEAKRKLKEQGGVAAPVVKDMYENLPKYTPSAVPLHTTEEMLTISKQVAPIEVKQRVVVSRDPEIQLARMQLPVCSSEQEIMEAIENHSVVILCGETGSGKTTQVPQFLYESGYGTKGLHPGMIGVTQPRRVAAVSTAQRVATELNVVFGREGTVGYQIRYDNEHVGDNTRVKFMTDGILLKEIQQDFLLKKYSIVLLDEAHERNVNTDILIGLLSRVAPFRAQMSLEENEHYNSLTEEEKKHAPLPVQPLKLVIMSATLRVEDFTENKTLFPSPPPVIKVEARQYPVTVHFNKHTELNDYVRAAYQKVVKIHRKLPEGAILVFLTGQREIMQLVRQLKRNLGSKSKRNPKVVTNTRNLIENEEWYIREHDDDDNQADVEEADMYGDEGDDDEDGEEDDGLDGVTKDEDEEEADLPFVHVLPLYSMLANDEQMKVFDAPPEKHRLIVVATNVAETSLTIPGVRYVVDAGRTKERVYDLKSGVSEFEIQWISKASADQRAGRAGRTGPGHCYRLYSSAVYDNEFKKFSPPQITCQPIEDVVLQMKAMGIENILQFPFPTPPEEQALATSVATLLNLGALHASSSMITGLGKSLAGFPVAPRFAKMLLLAKQLGCLEYAIAVVASLSGQSPFILERERREAEKNAENTEDTPEVDDMTAELKEAEAMRRHVQWMDDDSDVLSMLRAAGAYAFSGGSSAFCTENHLHEKIMEQMLKLRGQLTVIVNKLIGDDATPLKLRPNMPPPSDEEQDLLRQIIAAGFLDQVARRVPPGTITTGTKIERNCAYMACNGVITEPLYIHPHSHQFTPNPSQLPQYVVYNNIVRTSRAYMKTVTAIEPEWLYSVAANSPMCEISEPLQAPPPKFNQSLDRLECFVKPSYGTHRWELPTVQIEFPKGPTKARWFARYFLDGLVVSSFKSYFVGKLKEPSMSLIKKKYDAKIQLLVGLLERSNVYSKNALKNQWKKKPTFLMNEVLNWIQDNHKNSLKREWLAIVAQEIQD